MTFRNQETLPLFGSVPGIPTSPTGGRQPIYDYGQRIQRIWSLFR